MADICISYRRADSQAITGRIFDRLIANYGKDSIFIDIDNIPAGTDFRQYLAETLLKASVLLAVVGPKWLGAGKSGPDRILDEADPVRVEVETALRNGLAIIPVLIGSRKMPNPNQLPESLKEFVYLNAVTIDPGVDFDHHMQRLITNIDAILAAKRKARAPAAQSTSARRNTTQARPSRVSGQHSSRPASPTSDSRERRIMAAGASPRSAESPKQPSATASKRQGAGFLSGLSPRIRIPLVAGAAVVGLALLMFAFFALNTPDKGPGSASASSGAQAEGAKRAGGKCSVEGFSLDLRNCR
jgi:TIR domain-containing protein